VSDQALPIEVLERVAERFRALGEPARLGLLSLMRDGERTVTELVEASGLSQANVSRHLRVLHTAGLVSRRREGTWVHYGLADDGVLQLCDLVCGRVEREVEDWQAWVRDPRSEAGSP
jgi:DNA-binding transcriptional ArsR family regulator